MIATQLGLAFAGIRSRLLASALTVLLAAAAAATIVLALEVGATAREPWERTFAAAHGAHVLASVATEADAAAVAAQPGVAERDAAVPTALTSVASRGTTEPLRVAGLSAEPRINTPLVVTGTTSPGDGIVLERSFAEALGLAVGATVRLGAVDLPVVGTAIMPSQSRFPRSNPGLAWVSRETLERIEPDESAWRWSQAVRLADPTTAPAFAAHAGGIAWQDQRAEALREAQPITAVLTSYTVVLLLVVFAVVAILVGARAAAQHREIGLLKAVGFTPRQITTVFALESAALGLVAVAIGFAAGAVLAPRLAAPTALTTVAEPTMAASLWHLLIAAVPVLLVLVASVRTTVRRSARFTTMEALQTAAVRPARRGRIARAADRAPVALGLGLKDLLARRRRALRLGGAITVTGAAIVFALSMQATLDARPAGKASDVPAELPVLVYALDAVLLVITATTLVAVALLSVRERTRDYGVLQAIGLTPRQVAGSVVGAHAAVALVAAVLAIPLGIALYRGIYAASGGDGADLVIAPWPVLLLVPVGALLLVVVATSLPARVATRSRPADALRYE